MFDFLDQLKSCTDCALHTTRKQVVVGDGNLQARVLLMGEGPGADEDAKGLPFIGQSGSLLRATLQLQGFPMEDLYITNTVRCRPPNNRNPTGPELKACQKWTKKFIEALQPKLIVPVGKFAMQEVALLFAYEPLIGAPITKVSGKIYNLASGVGIYPLLHPAYILRSSEHAWYQEQVSGLMKAYQKIFILPASGGSDDCLQYPAAPSSGLPSAPDTPACT